VRYREDTDGKKKKQSLQNKKELVFLRGEASFFVGRAGEKKKGEEL